MWRSSSCSVLICLLPAFQEGSWWQEPRLFSLTLISFFGSVNSLHLFFVQDFSMWHLEMGFKCTGVKDGTRSEWKNTVVSGGHTQALWFISFSFSVDEAGAFYNGLYQPWHHQRWRARKLVGRSLLHSLSVLLFFFLTFFFFFGLV